MHTPALKKLRAALIASVACVFSMHVVAAEQEAEDVSNRSSRFWLEPLRQNYVLPYSYMGDPNQAPYVTGSDSEPVQNEEIKLQISLKVPLTYGDMLVANDELYVGFTLKAFWQAYNRAVSSPFRETNYRPELYYYAPLPPNANGGSWFGRLGIEHESNGRPQALSRSWNRVYVSMGYRTEQWAVMLQPWYRIGEDNKVDDGDPLTPPPARGDDNPDIEDFMGHFELTSAYIWGKTEFTGMFRQNFSTGNGAFELGVSVPLWGRLRGYAQYFEGYGESLIDYNYYNRRIGVGILFSDLL